MQALVAIVGGFIGIYIMWCLLGLFLQIVGPIVIGLGVGIWWCCQQVARLFRGPLED
jgi:hypothetical protein